MVVLYSLYLKPIDTPLDSLLNLPSIKVEGHSQIEGYVCFHIKILAKETNCYRCHKPSRELHQVRSVLVRDLPGFGQPVYLLIPYGQFYCRHCQKYFTEKLEFINWRRRHTRRYESNIVDICGKKS